MKYSFYPSLLLFCLLSAFQIHVKAAANVTLTSSAVSAATGMQGSATNVVYIAKMDVAAEAVTVNSAQVTLGGNHDANDLTVIYVYFNATDPTVAGATLLNGLAATFAAPHTYSINFSKMMDAGTSGYFIFTVSINNAASDGKTIAINGATNPAVFGFSTAPNLTNNQTNAAGTLTIQAADVTLTSSAVSAATVTQGSATNVVYIAKMDVATEAVTVNSAQVTLGGTHDANDLTVIYVYFNATDPTIAGATLLNGLTATFAAPHTYDINFSKLMDPGTSGYYIFTVTTNNTASDGKTIAINGATNPAVFGFTTTPNITNNQTNAAGTLTISASDVTLTSSAVSAATVTQGSATNVVYIAKMDVATEAVTVNSAQVTLGGTHDANDLTVIYVYFNATDPTIAGATLLNGLTATFAAPHTYNINFSKPMDAGTSGYYIFTVTTNNTASDGKTIVINGATDPATFGFTTAPNITNNQTNAAGTLTISAADVTLTSSAVSAATITQGSATNVVYIAKMDVATEAVTVNSAQVTLGGTHDANDLTVIYVYFNATDPTITGATLLNGLTATFAAPHTYDINFSKLMDPGTSGYYIFTVTTNNTASDGKTISVNGSTTPVVFGFTTAPNIINNQTNAAGTLTISAADITLTSSAVPASTVTQGSATNIAYVAKMDVATEAVTVNSAQVTLGGTHDANDLTVIYVYFNATDPTIAGATLLNGLTATFAPPHVYDINFSKLMDPGTSGYFIVTVSINNTASDGKTIAVNGSTTPVIFGFTSAPNITNNQSNAAGTLTIQAADVALTSNAVPAGTIAPGSTSNVVYVAKMDVATEAVTVNSLQVTLDGTHDANDLTVVYVYFNATDPTVTGATLLNGLTATFAAPHTYNINFSKAMDPGTSGYFIVVVNTNSTATVGNTIKVNGATDPIIFGFTTNPNLTNSQTDIAGIQTLPVNLVSITAQPVNNTVQINWVTASETNNAFFEIERSTDGITFNLLGKVNGKGTSTQVNNYSFVDELPGFGNNYYRLKQTDFDNNFQYSNIVQVSFNVKELTMSNVYPNPAKDILRYSVFSPENKKLLLHLGDMSGRSLITKIVPVFKGINQLELNISRFASGTYQIRITDPATNVGLNKRVVILR